MRRVWGVFEVRGFVHGNRASIPEYAENRGFGGVAGFLG